MLKFIKSFFGAKPTIQPEPEVPYKVETPAPAPVVETATQAMVESVAPPKKTRAKKPAAAKKPRKPKQPKQS